MTIDYPKHKNILLQILKDIFSDTSIAPFLGFKGGTAALMFYGLDRNSVDIDLDLLDEGKERKIFEKIQKIYPNGSFRDFINRVFPRVLSYYSEFSIYSPKKKPRSENSGRGILEIDHIEN